MKSAGEQLRVILDAINPILLTPKTDTVLQLEGLAVQNEAITFASRLGDIHRVPTVKSVELPFPKGKSYELVQGYNSEPTHNTDWSRFALDFGLKIGDTICAATNGYVVGMVEDYKYGGMDAAWSRLEILSLHMIQPQVCLRNMFTYNIKAASLKLETKLLLEVLLGKLV